MVEWLRLDFRWALSGWVAGTEEPAFTGRHEGEPLAPWNMWKARWPRPTRARPTRADRLCTSALQLVAAAFDVAVPGSQPIN